jgi:ABC-type multidrug transport system ATPase subunit/pSer/pThr/pTyr-binding forkhead associated (FHA) protein
MKITIGQSPANDIVLSDASVGSIHAVASAAGERILIEDRGTAGGTFLPGSTDRITSIELAVHESIIFGRVSVPVRSLAELLGLSTAKVGGAAAPAPTSAPAASVPVGAAPVASPWVRPPGSRVLNVGRGPANDIVLPNADAGLMHALLGESGGRYWIEDLNSPPATFINDSSTPVSGAFVTASDRLRFGSGEARSVQDLLRPAGSSPQQSHPGTSAAPAQAAGGWTRPAESLRISIGRAPGNDVVVSDPKAALTHAFFGDTGAQYWIEDCHEPPATFLNDDTAPTRGAIVTARDRVRIGGTSWRVSELAQKVGRRMVVGRGPANDIVLDVPTVGLMHAWLIVNPGGRIWVRDAKAKDGRGTFLNRPDNPISAGFVGVNDVIIFGTHRLKVSQILETGVAPAPTATAVAAAPRGGTLGAHTTLSFARSPGQELRLSIGREAGCDIVIEEPALSPRHAQLVVNDRGCSVRDLGSRRGTFVDGTRVGDRAVLFPLESEDAQGTRLPGSTIALGNVFLKFDAPEPLLLRVRRLASGGITLEARHVSCEVREDGKPKRILSDVSFTVYPTEFVGLMGPSGAGKSTLLTAIGGYVPPTEGHSLLNGFDLYESYDLYRGKIGYVPQDDIVYPQLTVEESLYYTAKLRLPSDRTEAQIRGMIDRIIEDLELVDVRKTLIGNAEKRGISGGQRKRVNLAQELITSPSLLLLDEPTSGLSSEDTLNVMRKLRDLADRDSRTIILTIHQPSMEAYREMDSVIYLMKGSLVYYGPTYPDSILYMNPTPASEEEKKNLLADPGCAMRPLARDQSDALKKGAGEVGRVVQKWSAKYEQSEYRRKYVSGREGGGAVQGQRRGLPERPRTGDASGWAQFLLLVRRLLLIKWRDTFNLILLAAQAPIIGALLVVAFQYLRAWGDPHATARQTARYDQGPAVLFLLTMAAVWFGCSNSAREIVGERSVFRRERMVNLRLSSYLGSKVAVLGGICALQCLVLLGIVEATMKFSEVAFGEIYLALVLTSLGGLGMGLTLSALVKSGEGAVTFVPILLIPQIMFGGMMLPLHQLDSSGTLLSSIVVSRWGFEGVLQAEYRDGDKGVFNAYCQSAEHEAACRGPNDRRCMALCSEEDAHHHPPFKQFKKDAQRGLYWRDMGVLATLDTMLCLLAGLILAMQEAAVNGRGGRARMNQLPAAKGGA